jgi:hypothetical protein
MVETDDGRMGNMADGRWMMVKDDDGKMDDGNNGNQGSTRRVKSRIDALSVA